MSRAAPILRQVQNRTENRYAAISPDDWSISVISRSALPTGSSAATATDEADLQQPEAEMHAVGHRKDPTGVGERIDSLRIEGQFLRQKEKADLPHVNDDAGEHDEAEHGHEGFAEFPGEVQAAVAKVLSIRPTQASPPRYSRVMRPMLSAIELPK